MLDIIKTLFILLISTSPLLSQIGFTKVDNFIEDGDKSFITIISKDVNNDQVDDIIHFDKGTKIYAHLSNRLGRKWKTVKGPFLTNDVWGGVVADLNNDGFQEIIPGSAYKNSEIYTYDYINEEFIPYQTLEMNIYIQNVNAVDVNADGFIDVFYCNDKGENVFFLNSEGYLEPFELIDFSTDPPQFSAGNYASQFIDFDLDGDQDLFISKCSVFADSADDPRRINQLFINDGKGNFQESAADYNLNSGAQSWSSDFGDLDLDGDLDLIVVNHGSPLQLYENVDNQDFVEVQEGSGLNLEELFFQVSLQDINNDGFQDVIITEDKVEIYLNNGDFTFEKLKTLENFPSVSSTFSLGDYNKDGLIDVVAKDGAFQSVSNRSSIMLQNVSNDNNWIKFQLEGVETNRDALGTRIELFAGNEVQNRILRHGCSYGVQFSNAFHFGLGKTTIVDSVKIYWLTGDVELLQELEVNKIHYVKQETCHLQTEQSDLLSDSECFIEELHLKHDSPQFKRWTNFSQNVDFKTFNEGTYFSIYGNDFCELESWKAYVSHQEIIDTQETRILYDTLGLLPCENEEVYLEVNDENALWNDEFTGSSFIATNEQDVFVSYTDNCMNYNVTLTRENVEFAFNAPEMEYQYDQGGSIEIMVGNPSAEWYDKDVSEPFHIGESYEFVNIVEDRFIDILNKVDVKYESAVGTESMDITVSSPSNKNNATIFHVREKIRLKSLRVKTNVKGMRRFEIVDVTGKVLHSLDYECEVGITEVVWDVELEEGDYKMRTNEQFNMDNFAAIGPLLDRLPTGAIDFPYSDEKGIVELVGSEGGLLFIYFDWKIEGIEEKECVDGWYETALKKVVSTEEDEGRGLRYNSVVTGELNLTYEGNHKFVMYDSAGSMIARREFEQGLDFDMTMYRSGVYFMLVDSRVYKLIKM